MPTIFGWAATKMVSELIYNCQMEGERISEELTKNTSGARTSAKRAYCKSRKASWRWAGLRPCSK